MGRNWRRYFCTPTIKALKQQNPDSRLIMYYAHNGHRAVFENNPYIDSLRGVSLKTTWRYPSHLLSFLIWRYPGNRLLPRLKIKKIDYVILNYQRIPLTLAYKKHVIDIVPEMFNIELKDKTVEMFFTKEEELKAEKMLKPYKNVVFIHVHSMSSPNHLWEQAKWEQLVKELPDYTFIQIGNTSEPFVNGALDWRGKTTLREAFCLFKYATSFVGVESNFGHVTSVFKLPGVVLFGDSSPLYWGHDNNINIYKGVPCAPCFWVLWGDPCPYGNECMKLITVEEVKAALIQQVNFQKSRMTA